MAWKMQRSQRSAREEEMLAAISEMAQDVAELRGEKDALAEERRRLETVIDLREQIETLTIERDRKQEEHDREKRDVEHMVGLEKKRAEQERELAVREAKLAVREEALTATVTALKEKLDFIQEAQAEQIGYLKDEIVTALVQRLPVVEWKHSSSDNGHKASVGARNGGGEGDDEE